MSFTDKEIREAFKDCKWEHEAAKGMDLPEAARSELVKMAALRRWINARADAKKKGRS